MKRFMFLSIGVLCLAIAVLIGFYVGSQRAEAQSNVSVVGYTMSTAADSFMGVSAMLPNGDIYFRGLGYSNGLIFTAPAYYIGNFWEGTVATDKSTWSGVKGQYSK